MSFDIKILSDEKDKAQLFEEWYKEATNEEAFLAIKEEVSSASSWNVVSDANTKRKLAIFDTRPVPAVAPVLHKTLRIYFSPEISASMTGQELEKFEEQLLYVIGILAYTFKSMLEGAKKTQEKVCKIYCEHPYVSAIMHSFAKYLDEKEPENFSVKFYSKWIEVKIL